MRANCWQIRQDVPSPLTNNVAAGLQSCSGTLNVALGIVPQDACDWQGHVHDERELREAPSNEDDLEEYCRQHLDYSYPHEDQTAADLLSGVVHQVLQYCRRFSVKELVVLLQHLAVDLALKCLREEILSTDHCNPCKELQQLLNAEEQKAISNGCDELLVTLVAPSCHATRRIAECQDLQRCRGSHEHLETNSNRQPARNLRVNNLLANVPSQASLDLVLTLQQPPRNLELNPEGARQFARGPIYLEGLCNAFALPHKIGKLLQAHCPLLLPGIECLLVAGAGIRTEAALHLSLCLLQRTAGHLQPNRAMLSKGLRQVAKPSLRQAKHICAETKRWRRHEGTLGLVVNCLPDPYRIRFSLLQTSEAFLDKDPFPAPLFLPMSTLLLRFSVAANAPQNVECQRKCGDHERHGEGTHWQVRVGKTDRGG
mmetsp:Transcript_7549/g.19166  ORF Transcript_7549/g.19166 Transcript_7549/m.19166 type:complete len:428 (+) Transcript_7549:1588-2871(+)